MGVIRHTQFGYTVNVKSVGRMVGPLFDSIWSIFHHPFDHSGHLRTYSVCLYGLLDVI